MAPVTCAVEREVTTITIVGDYRFDDVHRHIVAAMTRPTFRSPWVLIFDMRCAFPPPCAEEARARAAWIGGLRSRGLRACAVVVRPGAMIGISGIPVLEALGVPTRLFLTVAAADDWARSVIVRRTVVQRVLRVVQWCRHRGGARGLCVGRP